MTDFRALCAELVNAWDDLPWQCDWKGNPVGPLAEVDDGPFDRARAALVEPEPEKWDRPTLDEMRQIFDDHAGLLDDTPTMWWIDFRSAAKVLLDRWGK